MHRFPTVHLMIIALSLGALVRCDCEEVEFKPAASYTPDRVLDFGDVPVNLKKTMHISVLSAGSAGLKIVPNLEVDDDRKNRWKVDVEEDLLETGLAPRTTSTITVTYTPCPGAWNGDVLNDPFDPSVCDGRPDSALLKISEVDTVAGNHEITLSGQPVQPAVVTVNCPAGHPEFCNDPDPDFMIDCNGLSFGEVTGGETPCDMVVELQNDWRNDKPTGDLIIEQIEIKVKELNDQVLISGADAGFTLLNMDKTPLTITPDNPFVVNIDPGMQTGAKRFLVRFDGTASGYWRGQFNPQTGEKTGLRLYTSDPNRPIVTVPITATGAAPDIQYFPPQILFGPVEQHTTKTSTVDVSNAGTADLHITEISIANPEFQIMTSRGAPPITLLQSEHVDVFIRYTPVDTGADDEQLILVHNDLTENCDNQPGRTCIGVKGGAIPEIRIDPPDTLVFDLPNPPPAPPIPPRTQNLLMTNVGHGDLLIARLDITGPGGDPNSSSIDDFSIPAECPAMPCDLSPPISLVPGASHTFAVVYQNNDISQIDLAELRVSSNDPSDPEHIVVLSATDVPCLFPTPVITVLSGARNCVGQAVSVSASTSVPPDPNTITEYDWFWVFTQGEAPQFTAQNTVQTEFIPVVDGIHILGLNLTNSCGQVSQTVAQETILVSPTCN